MSPLDFGNLINYETPVNSEEDLLTRVHSGLVIINSKEQHGNDR